jgi:hypothetical protein
VHYPEIVRFFFRRHVPPIKRILVVESGERGLAERLIPILGRNHGDPVIDLLTCYPGLPKGCPPGMSIYATTNHPDRHALMRKLRERNYDIIAVICSGSPILFKTKAALTAALPAKVFVVNENADYFPLDYSNWRLLLRLALDRAGFLGPSAARNLASIVLFPFTLIYLLLYAGFVHTRRLFTPRPQPPRRLPWRDEAPQ